MKRVCVIRRDEVCRPFHQALPLEANALATGREGPLQPPVYLRSSKGSLTDGYVYHRGLTANLSGVLEPWNFESRCLYACANRRGVGLSSINQKSALCMEKRVSRQSSLYILIKPILYDLLTLFTKIHPLLLLTYVHHPHSPLSLVF